MINKILEHTKSVEKNEKLKFTWHAISFTRLSFLKDDQHQKALLVYIDFSFYDQPSRKLILVFGLTRHELF